MRDETEKSANNAIEPSTLLECPFCGTEFTKSGVATHYMGETYRRYTCPRCGVRSPKLLGMDALRNWWNTRHSNEKDQGLDAPRKD